MTTQTKHNLKACTDYLVGLKADCVCPSQNCRRFPELSEACMPKAVHRADGWTPDWHKANCTDGRIPSITLEKVLSAAVQESCFLTVHEALHRPFELFNCLWLEAATIALCTSVGGSHED